MRSLLVWCRSLYLQILVSLLLAVALGHFYPNFAIHMKPLGDGFIKLIRMIVPFIIFTTVVTGIANMKNGKEVGRIGLKAFVYIEVMTTFAMLIGMFVANVYQPGAGLQMSLQSLDAHALSAYTAPN